MISDPVQKNLSGMGKRKGFIECFSCINVRASFAACRKYTNIVFLLPFLTFFSHLGTFAFVSQSLEMDGHTLDI